MSKVILEGYIIVPDRELDVICDELPKHINKTRKEPGCLVFNVLQSQENPHRFDVYEEFIDKSAFEAHQNRVKKSKWGRVTGNVERFYNVRTYAG